MPPPNPLRDLSPDGRLLFATRSLRMLAYGSLSVVLLLYLAEVGLTDAQMGWLLFLTLVGDTLVSLGITTSADRIGRKRMLLISALMMGVSGLVFAVSGSYRVLLVAATIGIISPSDKEVGPFLSIEQAALSHLVTDARRTAVFAWYNLSGSFAAAIGAWGAGQLVQTVQARGATGIAAYRPVIVVYAAIGAVLTVLFLFLSGGIESSRPATPPDGARRERLLLGLHKSRGVVLLLSGLFALDAFGGGFIIQSITAYWFHLKFGTDAAALGNIFFWANLLAGISALAAGWLANRIGLINTMVFTHLPSNVLLLFVPLVDDVRWAVGLLLARFAISQMDVPTRQAFTMAVVAPDERSAAAGVTAVARSVGAAVSPLLAARMLAFPVLYSLPMLLAGSIKIVYDLLLYRAMAKRDRQGHATGVERPERPL